MTKSPNNLQNFSEDFRLENQRRQEETPEGRKETFIKNTIQLLRENHNKGHHYDRELEGGFRYMITSPDSWKEGQFQPNLKVTKLDLSPVPELADNKFLNMFLTLFPNVTELNLSGCKKINDEGLQHLKDKKFENLNLSDTSLTIDGLENLRGMDSLKILNIGTWRLIGRSPSDVFKSLISLQELYAGLAKYTSREDLIKAGICAEVPQYSEISEIKSASEFQYQNPEQDLPPYYEPKKIDENTLRKNLKDAPNLIRSEPNLNISNYSNLPANVAIPAINPDPPPPAEESKSPLLPPSSRLQQPTSKPIFRPKITDCLIS